MKLSTNKGFSLVEILVVMLILMVIIIGVLQAFMEMTQIRQRTDQLLDVQQNVRFALSTISSKIQMAGYQSPVDAVIVPDTRCDGSVPGPIGTFCSIPNRVQTTDGIMILFPYEGRRYLKPYYFSGGDLTCGDSGVLVPSGSVLNGNQVDICTPSGLDTNELQPNAPNPGQPLVACMPVINKNQAGCDFVIPNRMPPIFNSECTVSSPPGYLCCAIRTVATGPVCDSNTCTTTTRNPTTGICPGPPSCHEKITTAGAVWPSFQNPTPARCLFFPPVQFVHYQIQQNPNNGRNYLMMRKNFGLGLRAGEPEWQQIAADIVDMQICYFLDTSCDPPNPTPVCRRFDWNDPGTQFQCVDSSAPASVRNIRRVVLQLTARTAKPIQQSVGLTENPPCIPGAFPPQPVQPTGSAKYRQYTLCTDVLARNLVYKEITPPTIW